MRCVNQAESLRSTLPTDQLAGCPSSQPSAIRSAAKQRSRGLPALQRKVKGGQIARPAKAPPVGGRLNIAGLRRTLPKQHRRGAVQIMIDQPLRRRQMRRHRKQPPAAPIRSNRNRLAAERPQQLPQNHPGHIGSIRRQHGSLVITILSRRLKHRQHRSGSHLIDRHPRPGNLLGQRPIGGNSGNSRLSLRKPRKQVNNILSQSRPPNPQLNPRRMPHNRHKQRDNHTSNHAPRLAPPTPTTPPSPTHPHPLTPPARHTHHTAPHTHRTPTHTPPNAPRRTHRTAPTAPIASHRTHRTAPHPPHPPHPSAPAPHRAAPRPPLHPPNPAHPRPRRHHAPGRDRSGRRRELHRRNPIHHREPPLTPAKKPSPGEGVVVSGSPRLAGSVRCAGPAEWVLQPGSA